MTNLPRNAAHLVKYISKLASPPLLFLVCRFARLADHRSVYCDDAVHAVLFALRSRCRVMCERAQLLDALRFRRDSLSTSLWVCSSWDNNTAHRYASAGLYT